MVGLLVWKASMLAPAPLSSSRNLTRRGAAPAARPIWMPMCDAAVLPPELAGLPMAMNSTGSWPRPFVPLHCCTVPPLSVVQRLSWLAAPGLPGAPLT